MMGSIRGLFFWATLGELGEDTPSRRMLRTFYDVLEVPRSADDAQIKRAFKKLAMQFHPDRNPGDETAAKKFAEINEAFEVLSDPETRQVYDKYGEEGLRQRAQGGGRGAGFGGGGMQFDFGGFSFSFGGAEEEGQREVKGDDVTVDVYATLEDLYNGQEVLVHREKATFVETSGTRDCNCQQKVVTRQLGPGMFQQFTTTECSKCPNVEAREASEVLEVHLEPGMKMGEHVRFREEGEPHPDGQAGDLLFRVVELPHETFRRDGDDLHIDVVLTLTEALIGFRKALRHLDGRLVDISEEGVTSPGEERIIAGEGMPIKDSWGDHGDLHVHFSIRFPPSLADYQKDAVLSIGFSF